MVRRRVVPVRRSSQGGQAAMEFVLTYAGILLPVTFGIIFTAMLLWTWHSAVEWTRDGARYAVTHCFQGGGENVRNYMRTHVPVNMDQAEFSGGTATIELAYYSKDPDSGELTEFSCSGSECTTDCVPDVASVRVTGYQFRMFMSYLGLPPVTMPEFATTLPIESAGCDPEQGTCLP